MSFQCLKLGVFTTAQVQEKDDITLDTHSLNQPVNRKAEILQCISKLTSLQHEVILVPAPNVHDMSLSMAGNVHDEGLLQFLETAWDRWVATPHRDPDFFAMNSTAGEIPSIIPGNYAQRDASAKAGKSVASQCSYYCADDCVPIHRTLMSTLAADATVVKSTLEAFPRTKDSAEHFAAYALVTHPGHHAARNTSAGYCYVNSAAIIADTLRRDNDAWPWIDKVAVIDVDYHCGNGTIGIFWDDADVFVASLHADPDIDYPYNCGFSDQVGGTANAAARGATMCLPLGPGARWRYDDDGTEFTETSGCSRDYRTALEQAVMAAKTFGAKALVVSLGVDTLIRDPVAVPGAGFCIELEDYIEIGKTLRQCNVPTVFLQEGGYDMERLGSAVSNTLLGFCNPSGL